MRNIICIILALSLAFAFCSCGKDKKEDAAKETTIDNFEEPIALEQQIFTLERLTYTVPDGFGSMASDNEMIAGAGYQNENNLLLEIEILSSKDFKDFDASSANGTIDVLCDGADAVKDVTVGNFSGKRYAFKEDGKTIEVGLAINVDEQVYLCNMMGEKDGESVAITEEEETAFNQFCDSLIIDAPTEE